MKILVVNAGSSSLKYQLFDMESGDILAKGICERIAIDGKITHKLPDGRKIEMNLDMPNHAVATKILVDTLTNADYGCIKDMSEIEAVGHR
ncbi:MAG: acetate kinase, partial [Butyricicoccus sp.]|nr:acetate kinase [Butyricicoccus sp.]